MSIPFKRYGQLLRQYLAPQWPRVALLGLAMFFGIGLQLAGPQILRTFIDAAREGAATRMLVRTAGLFLGVGIATQLASAAATYLGAQVAWRATNRVREDLARHCLRLDMSFHNDRTPGQMIERVDGDVTNLSNFFSQFIIQILGGVVLCAGILALLFRENRGAGLLLSLFAVLAFAVLLRHRALAVPAARRTREASSRLFGFLEEKLAGLEDLRSNAGGPYVLDRFYRVNHRFFHASRKSWMLQSALFMMIMGLFAVGYALAIGSGVYLYQQGAITLGTVFLFIHYTEMLRMPLNQVARQVQDLQNASAGIARIDALLQEPRRMDAGGVEALPPGPLSVGFDRVSFAYRDEPVLRDLSLQLAAGRSLGLVGKTGSGKTTIARLLFRLYDPAAGTISLGGRELRGVDLAALRNRIGMVTQDVQLFEGTVRENLAFFRDDVSLERMWAVTRELGLRAWYERLPQGFDTMLESHGANLSAGEAQLIAFTRVFLRNPSLVILDEPSSRMDPVTENLVKQAIRKLVAGRTAIVIAHRLTTLEMVDDLLLLEDGRCIERGPRATLAADANSRYHELLRVGDMQEGAS